MKLKNFELKAVIEFLTNMELKGRGSLGRSAFKKEVSNKNMQYSEEQVEIIDEFDGWLDKDAGLFDNTNEVLKKSNLDLGMKDVEITVDSPFLDDFIESLKNYEQELSGNDADVFALFYEELIKEEK